MAQIKILVIDDDEDTTDILAMMLSPTASTILVANSGKDGLELATKSNPDIIILDLMMPGMTGWEFCKQLREVSAVPVLVLSAIDSPDAVAQALDVGADDYLVKPVSSATLIARLNKLFRRQQSAPFSSLTLANQHP